MMKFNIKHQDEYSRGQLLLRSFLGPVYMFIPHMICLAFLGMISGLLRLVTFFAILFTGKFPKGIFDYQVKFFRWYLRLIIRLHNLSDGYPAFGFEGQDDHFAFDIPYVEEYPKGKSALVFFFGGIMLIPHIFCLYGLMLGAIFVGIAAWFTVLFTGKYPPNMHNYMVKMLRWMFRIIMYLFFMNQEYPPFSGKPDDELMGGSDVLDNVSSPNNI
jgi:hypothetical protein